MEIKQFSTTTTLTSRKKSTIFARFAIFIIAKKRRKKITNLLNIIKFNGTLGISTQLNTIEEVSKRAFYSMCMSYRDVTFENHQFERKICEILKNFPESDRPIVCGFACCCVNSAEKIELCFNIVEGVAANII